MDDRDVLDTAIRVAYNNGWMDARDGMGATSVEMDAARQAVRDSLARIRAVVEGAWSAWPALPPPPEPPWEVVRALDALTADDRRLLSMEP